MDALVEQFIMPNFSIIISKRNSGKTHILQNLCKRLLESGRLAKANIVLMSSTASISGDWSFLPDSKKRFAYDEEVLKKLLVWQRRRITLLKKRADRSKTSVVLPSLVLVLDDILGTGGNRQKGSGNKHHAFSETLRWLACQGRHFKITVLFAVQSPAVVQSTVIRGNADFVLLGQLSVEQQAAAFRLVTGRTYAQFKQMVSENDNYGFWLYNTLRPSGDRWTQVRAEEDFDPRFRLAFKNHKKKVTANKQKNAKSTTTTKDDEKNNTKE